MFRLFLPIAEQAVAENRQSIEYEDRALPGGNETILLAEDESSVQSIATRILQDAGYRVITASDGEEAVSLFREHADMIQLLLLDAVMPRQTGHQVYRQIKQISPTVQAVLCTGYDPQRAQSETLEELELPVIRKPYSKLALLEMVRQTLDAPVATEELALAMA